MNCFCLVNLNWIEPTVQLEHISELALTICHCDCSRNRFCYIKCAGACLQLFAACCRGAGEGVAEDGYIHFLFAQLKQISKNTCFVQGQCNLRSGPAGVWPTKISESVYAYAVLCCCAVLGYFSFAITSCGR